MDLTRCMADAWDAHAGDPGGVARRLAADEVAMQAIARLDASLALWAGTGLEPSAAFDALVPDDQAWCRGPLDALSDALSQASGDGQSDLRPAQDGASSP